MKIRNEFVSNSSSSSFVVCFPREPKNAEDVRNMLFSIDQEFYSSEYGDNRWCVKEVAETVWKDICGQTKDNIESAKYEIMNGYIYGDGAPESDDFRHIKDYTQRYQAYDEAREIYAKKRIKEFFNTRTLKLKKIDGQDINEVMYIFEYSDNDGEYYSALEHGGLFDNLKHITISKH